MRIDEAVGSNVADPLHELGDLVRLDGSTPQVTLREIAAERLQFLQVLLGLKSFGDGGQAEAAGEVDHGLDKDAILGVRGDSADEATVDLEDVDGQFPQAGE